MTRIKLRYYVIKRGKGFWQPTPKIKAHGFASVPCGVDGPDAWKIVEIWNNRWDAARRAMYPRPQWLRRPTFLQIKPKSSASTLPAHWAKPFGATAALMSGNAKRRAPAKIGGVRGAASSLCSETVIREPLRLRISVRGARRSKTQCRSAKHIGQ